MKKILLGLITLIVLIVITLRIFPQLILYIPYKIKLEKTLKPSVNLVPKSYVSFNSKAPDGEKLTYKGISITVPWKRINGKEDNKAQMTIFEDKKGIIIENPEVSKSNRVAWDTDKMMNITPKDLSINKSYDVFSSIMGMLIAKSMLLSDATQLYKFNVNGLTIYQFNPSKERDAWILSIVSSKGNAYTIMLVNMNMDQEGIYNIVKTVEVSE